MSLDPSSVDRVLELIRSSSLELRLKAIEEAICLHKTMFADNCSLEQWAYSALICESLYNTTRDILKEGYKQLVPKEVQSNRTPEIDPRGEPRIKAPKKTKILSSKTGKLQLSKDPTAIAELLALFKPPSSQNPPEGT